MARNASISRNSRNPEIAADRKVRAPFTHWNLVLTMSDTANYIRVALDGVVAQLVERLNGIQEVRGSNPLGSTILPERQSHFFDGTGGAISDLCAVQIGFLIAS